MNYGDVSPSVFRSSCITLQPIGRPSIFRLSFRHPSVTRLFFRHPFIPGLTFRHSSVVRPSFINRLFFRHPSIVCLLFRQPSIVRLSFRHISVVHLFITLRFSVRPSPSFCLLSLILLSFVRPLSSFCPPRVRHPLTSVQRRNYKGNLD